MVQYRHITVYSDKHRYTLGPCIAVTQDGDWICSFNMSVIRELGPFSDRAWLHPPIDPEYRNYLTRSKDGGETWDAPRVLPGYDWHGGEHAALCVLANGDVLASQYLRVFYPLETGLKKSGLLGAWVQAPYPWVVSHGGTYVHRSRDGGLTWDETVEIPTGPYVSGYSPRPLVEMPDGTLLQPLAAADPFYDDHFDRLNMPGEPLGNDWGENGEIIVGKSAAFVAISRTGGHTWTETHEIARDPDVSFYEPTLARLNSGRLICHLRTEKAGNYQLYQVTSDDGGETWCKAWQTPMWGRPAHIVQLPDGRVLSVYGHRRVPYGVRACLSSDDGDTWDYDNELIIRDDIPRASIGYPTAIVLEDGTVFTVYWTDDGEGRTAVEGTYFKP